jgi:hypothetical protein
MPGERHRDGVLARTADGRGQPMKQFGRHHAFDSTNA